MLPPNPAVLIHNWRCSCLDGEKARVISKKRGCCSDFALGADGIVHRQETVQVGVLVQTSIDCCPSVLRDIEASAVGYCPPLRPSPLGIYGSESSLLG